MTRVSACWIDLWCLVLCGSGCRVINVWDIASSTLHLGRRFVTKSQLAWIGSGCHHINYSVWLQHMPEGKVRFPFNFNRRTLPSKINRKGNSSKSMCCALNYLVHIYSILFTGLTLHLVVIHPRLTGRYGFMGFVETAKFSQSGIGSSYQKASSSRVIISWLTLARRIVASQKNTWRTHVIRGTTIDFPPRNGQAGAR